MPNGPYDSFYNEPSTHHYTWTCGKCGVFVNETWGHVCYANHPSPSKEDLILEELREIRKLLTPRRDVVDLRTQSTRDPDRQDGKL